jgi:hypothetical protein
VQLTGDCSDCAAFERHIQDIGFDYTISIQDGVRRICRWIAEPGPSRPATTSPRQPRHRRLGTTWAMGDEFAGLDG